MTFPLPNPYTVNITARRVMMFADGENLVKRYEDLVAAGRQPLNDVVHRPNDLVWHPGFMHQIRMARGVVIRATYYTSTTRGDEGQRELSELIRRLQYPNPFGADGWPCSLSPQVFKRERGGRSKAVDIQLTVDALGHVFRDNVDTVLLLGGDGDYVPLVEEILRAGKLLFLASFSRGLNPRLAELATEVYLLDNTSFVPQ